jgi:quercetin 2,3-dioxygenase
MYAAELEAGNTLTFDMGQMRQLYVKVMEGAVSLNGVTLRTGDAAEVTDKHLQFSTDANTHLLVVEMAE